MVEVRLMFRNSALSPIGLKPLVADGVILLVEFCTLGLLVPLLQEDKTMASALLVDCIAGLVQEVAQQMKS